MFEYDNNHMRKKSFFYPKQYLSALISLFYVSLWPTLVWADNPICNQVVQVSASENFLSNFKPENATDDLMRSAFIFQYRQRLAELDQEQALTKLVEAIEDLLRPKRSRLVSDSNKGIEILISDKRSAFIIEQLGFRAYKTYDNLLYPPRTPLDIFAYSRLYRVQYPLNHSFRLEPALVYFRNETIDGKDSRIFQLIRPAMDVFPDSTWSLWEYGTEALTPEQLGQLQQMASSEEKSLVFLPTLISDMLRIVE